MDTQLKKDIGSLFVVGFNGTVANAEIKDLISKYYVGSIILFSRNLSNPQQVRELTGQLQQIAKDAGHTQPLLIAVDQENGIVNRLGEILDLPGAMSLAATNQSENAYQVASYTASTLRELGINWNLAPVVDVNNNPDNPVIGVRSFSSQADKVADFGSAFVRGLQEQGVLATLKHFPGHGDTAVDSHLSLPVIRHDIDRLKAIELLPFKAGIDNNIATIMTAHIYFPDLIKEDNVPASLSYEITTGLLRNELGYNGVITTDCLEMKAISDTVGTANGAVQAVLAGADIAMVSHTYEIQKAAIEAMYQAYLDGILSNERIHLSLQRVKTLKDNYLQQMIPSKSAQLDLTDIYQQSITFLTGEFLEASQKILFCQLSDNHWTIAEEKKNDFKAIETIIKRDYPNQNYQLVDSENINRLTEHMDQYDALVWIISTIPKDKEFLSQVQLSMQHNASYIIGIKDPYIFNHFKDANQIGLTYQPSLLVVELAFKALFGEIPTSGTLPIEI